MYNFNISISFLENIVDAILKKLSEGILLNIVLHEDINMGVRPCLGADVPSFPFSASRQDGPLRAIGGPVVTT